MDIETERKNRAVLEWLDVDYEILAAALAELVRVQGIVNDARPERLQPTPENVTTYGLALIHEVGELQDELGWKPWKPLGTMDLEAAEFEFADVLAFLGMLAHYMLKRGSTFEHIAEAYGRKSAQNKVNCDAESSAVEMRECERCGTTMALDFFGKSRNGGYTKWCLRCLRVHKAEGQK